MYVAWSASYTSVWPASVVQSDCEPVLERFSFKWPAVLDCSRLPDGDADRSRLCIDPPAADHELDDALGPPGLHAPANNLQLRRLLDALRSHNSSSSSSSSSRSHDVIGDSPPASRDSTVMTSRGSVCPQRYAMTEDSSGSSGSECRPRCDDVLYRADDKRSVYIRVQRGQQWLNFEFCMRPPFMQTVAVLRGHSKIWSLCSPKWSSPCRYFNRSICYRALLGLHYSSVVCPTVPPPPF